MRDTGHMDNAGVHGILWEYCTGMLHRARDADGKVQVLSAAVEMLEGTEGDPEVLFR
jgi:hypothetical protein